MKTLFTRFNWDNAKEFITTRNLIGKSFYLLSMIVYAIMWTFNKPDDIPLISSCINYVMIPILLFTFHMRTYHYVFLYNWYYILYLIVTTTTFFIVMSTLHPAYNKSYFIFEFGHIIAANLISILVAIFVSAPFKIVQWFICETDEVYYDTEILNKIEGKIFPEKKKKKVEQNKQKFVYDGMNETQLQIELKLALEEDRFEDAEKIRKILDKKF